MALVVPAPVLSQPKSTAPTFSAVMPINVACGPVTFPDGSLLTLQAAEISGWRLFRELNGGIRQVWNPDSASWQPEATEVTLGPVFFQNDTWQSIVIDTDQAIFATDVTTGFPKYMLRCFFRGKDAEGNSHDGSSPSSAQFEASAPGQQDRGVISIVPDPETATEMRLSLRDASLTEQAHISIRRSGSAFIVELAAGSALITLRSNGAITVNPAGAAQLRVEGDLNVNGRVLVRGIVVHP